MGEFVGCDCPHCNEEIGFFEGIGFFHHPDRFNDVEELCNLIDSEEIKHEVKYLFMNKNAKFYERSYKNTMFVENINYGMRVYYSKHTQEVYNLFYFELKYLENGKIKIYKPNFKDSSGKRLQRIELDEIGLLPMKCPYCKKLINEDGEFIPMSMGCWD